MRPSPLARVCLRALVLSAIACFSPIGAEAANLLNVQFTGDLNPGFVRKQGPAAIGQSAGDVWNVYSRDIDSAFNWRDSGQLNNLVWANGQSSGVSLSVNNAAGLWGTDSKDPMLHTYLYPLGRSGEITVTLSNLPTGSYRLYFYAHGQPPEENGTITVSAGGKDYGRRSTSSDPAWDPGTWVEGGQFVIFDGVQVTSSGDLVIHSQPGVSGLAVANGLQLQQLADDIPDRWREQYFGPGFASDPRAAATADPDADGANNHQEYLAGTNPLDPGSIKTVPLYVSTYAGSTAGDQDGYRTEATFSSITSAIFDPAGRLWITEGTISGYNEAPVGSHRVRMMDLDQVFRTIAGSAEPGLVNGPLDVARFAIPNNVTFDRQGNVLIADRGNHQIRKIDPGGNVTTFAGSTQGYRDGPAAVAMFDTPTWVVSDGAEGFYVADFFNLRIRKITSDGVVSTFAGGTRGAQDGPAAAATFNSPNVMAMSRDGTLFISDWANGQVRKVKNGIVSTFATGLPYTDGVTVDDRGNVYAVSGGSQIVAKFLPDGTRSWTLGTGQGFADGPAGVAKFSSATGPPVPAPDGTLILVDWGNNRLRQITVGPPPLIAANPAGGSFVAPVTVTLTTSVKQGVVRYTLNGLDPDFSSLIAAGPITISETAVLKSQVFVNGVPVSSVSSEVYMTSNGPCTPAPDGLAAWWRGEGTAQDQVGGHDATLVGRALYQTAAVGSGFAFDGTGDCLRIPNAADLNNDTYSVEAWVDPLGQVVDHDGQDLIFGQAFGRAQLVAVPGASGVKVRWQFAKDQSTFTGVTSSRELPRNQFTHLVGTWDGVGLRVYINGQLDAESDANAVPQPSTCDFFIGGFQDACGYTGQSFNGVIDELSFYRRPLSAGEVQALFRAGAAGKCTPGSGCVPPAGGLVGWWPAEGNAADLVAGQDGALAGGAGFQRGAVGESFQLNGVDGRVRVPASGQLDVGPGAGLTVESWINPEEIQRQDPIVEWNSDGKYGSHFYISVVAPFGGGPGCLFANLVDTAGIEHTITTGPGVIGLGQFQHVAVTYDRASGQAALYRNGQIVAQQNLGSFIPQTSYDLYFGYRPPGWYGSSLAFTGRIDEVSVYNRSLTPAEISSVFRAGAAGKCRPGSKPAAVSDLAADWSDSSNPNGPWALRAGSVLLPHVPNWNLDMFSPAQPGWAFGDTVPFWFKSTSRPPAAGDDWQIGDVIVHTHAPGTPNGGNNGLANVTWTSPINGRIDIEGAVWEARDILSADGGLRGNRWNLYVRDVLVSTGAVKGGDLFSRAKPFTLDLGTGGADALRNVSVAVGDVVRLEFVPTSYEGDYVGVHFAVTLAPSSGLLAAWSFDESGGRVAHDTPGGLNGSLSPGASFVLGGVIGGALSLDHAANGFVNMGNVLPLTDTSFSIVAWVKTKPGDATENLLVVAKHEAFINNGYFLNVNRSGILGEPGKAMFFAGDANNVPVSKTIVNDGQWHQLVGVHELNGQNLIYVDGRPEGATPSLPVQPSTAPLLIGGDSYGGQVQGLFTGLIDEVQIYGRALQPEEIASLFENPGLPIPEAAQVSTLAGSGNAAFADGQGVNASFNAPNGGFVTADGSAWIADTRNHRIRRVDIHTGSTITVAGTGIPGVDNGPADSARFSSPLGVCVDSAGSVLIADTDNNRIRKLVLGAAPWVSNVAGNGLSGYVNGPAAQAEFDFPNDLVVDTAGNIYVTEFNNHTVRKITPDGTVSTWVGNGKPGYADGIGTAAGLNQPAGLALDASGNLYLTEWGSHRIRKVSPSGQTTTLAGGISPGFLDGAGALARFFQPDGIAVDATGVIYVTEHGNHAIRRISPEGVVTTVSGTGAPGYLDGPADKAQFNGPGGIGVDATGRLIIADTANERIRTIRLPLTPPPASGPPIVFERQLPPVYAAGTPLTVQLRGQVQNAAGTAFAYAVEEAPPAGWTVSQIGGDGSYDAVRKTVKFGPFLDQAARVLSYSVTPAAGESGSKLFHGIVSVDGNDFAIKGQSVIDPPVMHPADLNPADFRLTISETTAYASAWRKGQPWTIGPNPIPIDYVTRAGVLWRKGESYRLDPSLGGPPLWWTSQQPLFRSPRAEAALETNSVVAVLPSAFFSGEPFAVHLAANPAAATLVYAIEYRLPAHLTVAQISDSGAFDTNNLVLKWGPFFDNAARNVSFVATANGSVTSLVFSGEGSFDGQITPVNGPGVLRAAVRLNSLTMLPNGEFGLDLAPANGAAYEIETSADLRTWEPLTLSTNKDGLLRFKDPHVNQVPQRFYRAIGP